MGSLLAIENEFVFDTRLAFSLPLKLSGENSVATPNLEAEGKQHCINYSISIAEIAP